MAKSEIIGTNNVQAQVTSEGALLVTQQTFPPFESQKVRPFRQYFTLDGTTSGDNDMGQNGSVNNLDFYIQSDDDEDVYITSINIQVGYGTAAQPFQFGDGAVLSNGVRFWYDSIRGEVDIHDAIKSNQDLFRLSSNAIDSNWELRGVGASNDYGYFVFIDLTKFLPQGIKLDAGTNQRIHFTIRDSMTAVSGVSDSFNAIAYGYNRYL